jgi:type 1 glutamine amidotransferase
LKVILKIAGIVFLLGVNIPSNGICNAADSPYDWTTSDEAIALRKDGQTIWQFNAAGGSKPYFHPLCVVGSNPLTMPKPADHPWHLAHWFSWKYINGVNYWEENEKGESDGLTVVKNWQHDCRDDGSATITMTLDYQPSITVAPVLSEKRTITISAPVADGSYYLDWAQEFTAEQDITLDRTPVPGEPHGFSWGGYAGLSVRFSNDLKNVLTSFGGKAELKKRDGADVMDVYHCPAAEMNGVLDGKEYGIAIIPSPKNHGFGNWYVIQGKDFLYYSPATLLSGAYFLKKGECFNLQHRVCIHKGRWDAKRLTKEAEKLAARPKILILSGSNNHDWQATTPFIQQIYARNGQFAVDVTHRPDSIHPRMLAAYQAVVSNWNAFPEQSGLWNPAAKQALQDFIRKGGGFVCIHAASATHYDWSAYLQIAGGRWGDKTHHGAIHDFDVQIIHPEHPITKGMQPFTIKDELWVDLECDAAAEILCAARAKEYADQPDKLEPVALVTRYGKGQGFYLVLGHDIHAMSSDHWQTLLLRGTQWISKSLNTNK